MALAPFAIHKLLPLGPDRRIAPIGAVLHVAESLADSLYPYFNGPSNGVESHFYVRFDGTVEQYRDTGYEADANLEANSFLEGGTVYGFVSIETQGRGSGEWTPAQLESIKRLLLWLRATHGVPLVVCPGPREPGVGYHIMFGSPGPWTTKVKTCPGPDRIKQYWNVIVPWMEGENAVKITEPQWAKSSIDHLVTKGAFPNGRPVLEEENMWRTWVYMERLDASMWKRMQTWVKSWVQNHVKTALAAAMAGGVVLGESQIGEIVARTVQEIGRTLLGG